MKCTFCGFNIPEGACFCPECGHKIDGNEFSNMPIQKKNNSAIIALVCVVVAILYITIAVVIFGVIRGGIPRILGKAASNIAPTAAPTETMRPIQTYAPSYNGNSSYGGGGVYANGGTYNSGSSSYGEYLFPSDTLYITDNDLRGKSRSEVRYILNEIYARNGYIFNNENYRQYFSSKSWYFGNTTSQQEAESRFNAVETANRNFIISYEKSRGWR